MSQSDDHRSPCERHLRSSECLVSDMDFTPPDRALLTIARFFFLAFSEPAQHDWMRAFDIGRQVFGAERGAAIAAGMLDLVRDMRLARRSRFHFSNPDCPCCANVLCESERQLMGIVAALAQGKQSEAHANALLLCEGNDIGALLDSGRALVALMEYPAHFTPRTGRGLPSCAR
ncbi:MAG: hypothetical protein AAF748_10730 [Pseudomonadota bacterium]